MKDVGLLILLIAGAMNGSFTIPMKFTRKWEWENTWSTWTFFTLVFGPAFLTAMTIPQLISVYAEAGLRIILTTSAYGIGWGISVVFFGFAVQAVGTALAFSIILGISASIGSLLPLVRLHPEYLGTMKGFAVLGSIGLVLVGVGICAWAGKKREAALGLGPATPSSFGKGFLLCVLSGAGSAFLNLGLAFAGPILSAAHEHGARNLWTANAALLPALAAGAVPNFFYCFYLMRKNSTTSRFRARGTGSYWILTLIMSACWLGSVTLYGISTNLLGSLSIVLAWPLFMSLIVITAAAWGALTGEWKGAGKMPVFIMSAGIAVLVVAIFALSFLTNSG